MKNELDKVMWIAKPIYHSQSPKLD